MDDLTFADRERVTQRLLTLHIDENAVTDLKISIGQSFIQRCYRHPGLIAILVGACLGIPLRLGQLRLQLRPRRLCIPRRRWSGLAPHREGNS